MILFCLKREIYAKCINLQNCVSKIQPPNSESLDNAEYIT